MLRPYIDPSAPIVGNHRTFTQICKTVVSFILAFFGSASIAFSTPYHTRIAVTDSSISINGRTALTVPGALGGRRAAAAEAALRVHSSINVLAREETRRKWSIVDDHGKLVLSVTLADARVLGGTVEDLARSWAHRIDALAAIPALKIESFVKPLVVPTGGFRSLIIGGSALPGDVCAANAGQTVTTATYDADSRTITLEGLKPGTGTVTVTATDSRGGSTQVSLPVLVEDRAGEIDSDADAAVFGTPASADVLVQSVRSAVYRSVHLNLGACLEVVKEPTIASALSSGDSVNVPVTVRAAGSDLIPNERTIEVHVDNDPSYVPETAQALFYSNNPETVKHPQSLFDAPLPSRNRPVRLVFHHVNSSASPQTMRVEIINRGQETAHVRLIRGLSGESSDPVAAGVRAGAEFVREWQNDSGQIVSVPAQSRLELFVMKTLPGEVASGIFEVAQTDGLDNTVLLHIDAENVDTADATGLDILAQDADPDRCAMALLPLSIAHYTSIANETSSDQIYATPSLNVVGTYTVGAAWLHLVIGTDQPLSRFAGSGAALSGNYGVIYTLNLTLVNPDPVRRMITVTFGADAGDAAGVFTVSGQPTLVIDDLEPSNEQQIDLVTMPPNSTKDLSIQTMPLSGSAYPASIGAHVQ